MEVKLKAESQTYNARKIECESPFLFACYYSIHNFRFHSLGLLPVKFFRSHATKYSKFVGKCRRKKMF